jgi:GLPGLI family protein
MRIRLLFSFFFTGFAFFATNVFCQFEGRISYSIAYQTDQAELGALAGMLPKLSTLKIKGNKLRYDQPLAGGGRQAFIIDGNAKTNTLLMNFLGQEFKVKMEEEELLLLESAESYEITTTDQTKMIEGYECKMALAISGEDTLTVFYTEAIQCPPVLPQFSDIKGLPLYYEMKKGGFFMKYTCTKIEDMIIPNDDFEIPGSIREIPFKEFANSFAITKQAN